MICHRCHGMMSKKSTSTFYEEEIFMFHCLNCGEWIDKVVVSHRDRSQTYNQKVQSGADRPAAASLWWESIRNKKQVVS